ncbi:MAG: efflux RND transporter permease subunit [Rhodanobacter sp.]|jgi:multidrug efflux pump|nr:efflux RND transporter permease subunit [Rhodanobacter sp.]
MNISGPFIRRPVGTSLLAIGLFVGGMIAYVLLGVAALPSLDFPAVFILASEPGADARTMASTVAAPLERHLGQIAGIDEMPSRSAEGSSSIVLMFNIGLNVDAAARDVQAAINAAAPDLPSGLKTAPVYRKANPNNAPVLILALTSNIRPLSELYNMADSLLTPRIAQQSGVASVDIAGGATPAVRVDVDLRALSALGLSVDQLRNALVAANVTSPQGFLSDGKTTMAVTANDALHSAQEFADIVIATHNGTPVHLQEVAHVYAGQEDAYQGAWFDGQRAILIVISKRADANVIGTVDAIRAQIPQMQTWLPADVKITPFSDRTPTIRASVKEVQISLMISIGMVILTMLLFLRRAAPTAVAGLSVPLSLAGAFATMYFLHFTLNNLSLMALVVSIGFVVDDAIVVIENIVRHLDQGKSRLEATLAGAREIGFTVVSITLSLLAVFTPLIFMGGILGLVFREFAVTLAAAVAISALVSLTVTPSLCGRFLNAHTRQAQPSRVGAWLDRFHAGMLGIYRHALDFALHHPRLMALQPLLLVVLTGVLAVWVAKGFFPQQDTGQLQGTTRGSPDVSYVAMSARHEQVTELIRKDPAVESVGSTLGSGHFSGHGNSGTLYINLKPLGQGRTDSTFAVMNRLMVEADRVPGIRLRLRPVQDLGGGGSSGGAQYEYTLKGDNIDELVAWAPRLVAELRTLPQLKDVDLDIDSAGGLRETVIINRDQAARLNVSAGAIDGALYDAFGQRQVSTIYSDINQYKVVVNALPDQAVSPESLKRLYVRSNTGAIVPLTAVAQMQRGLAPTEVEHDSQFPVVTISFNLAPDVSMGEAGEAIIRTMAGMRMPGSISGQFGGDFRRFQQAQGSQGWLILAAIFAIYIVLGILYESLIHPITILSTLPSAGVGALLALKVTNTELSIVSVIAIVLLIGIVKKNAIMMIDFALAAQRERGLAPFDAIREACLVRFRPIMMTSMVAILGALPLAIGFGAGAELRQPLGIAMIGGLIVSQSLTLVSTPAIYLLFARASERRRQRKEEKRARQKLASQARLAQ